MIFWFTIIFSTLISTNVAEKFQTAGDVTSFPVGNPIELESVPEQIRFLNIVGEIPENSFVNLANISYLQIRHGVTYIQPGAFRKLSKLEHLDLYGNSIRYLLNSTFMGASNVKFLNLGGNQLNYMEPASFRGLFNLENLELNFNRDLKVLRNNVFFGLTRLQKLHLMDCGIDTIERSAFYRLERLETLDLSKNNLEDVKGSSFDELIKLTDLDLSYNKLTNIDVFSFKRMISLRKMNIIYNNIKCSKAQQISEALKATVQVIIRTTTRWGCIE